MKKLALLVWVVLLGTTISIAQNLGGQRNFDPEEMAKRQTEELTKVLDLDKSQVKKVSELNMKAADQMAEMRKEMAGGNGDREAMRQQMGEMRKKQNAEMKKILSDDQYKKYQKYLEERRSRRGGGQGGGRR